MKSIINFFKNLFVAKQEEPKKLACGCDECKCDGHTDSGPAYEEVKIEEPVISADPIAEEVKEEFLQAPPAEIEIEEPKKEAPKKAKRPYHKKKQEESSNKKGKGKNA